MAGTRALLLVAALALLAAPAAVAQHCPSHGLEVVARITNLEHEDQMGTIFWPEVTGTGVPGVIRSLNSQLAYDAVTGETIEETVEIFGESGRGISGAIFRVNYDHGNILDISMAIDFLGAYPSTFEHYFTFDTRTGDRLDCRELFLDDRLDDLVALLDERLQCNIQAKKDEYPEEDWAETSALDQHFSEEDLARVTVTLDGIVFRHEFGFPHADLALEPDGEVMFSFEQLEDYLDPDGPLSTWDEEHHQEERGE